MAVYDTNVLGSALAALLGRPPRRSAATECVLAVRVGAVRLATSRALREELLDVVQRPEAFALPQAVAEAAVTEVLKGARPIRPRPAPATLTRDPDDQALLDCAWAAGARYLVTRNLKDFVELVPGLAARGLAEFRWRGLLVLRPEPFLARLRAAGRLHV